MVELKGLNSSFKEQVIIKERFKDGDIIIESNSKLLDCIESNPSATFEIEGKKVKYNASSNTLFII